MKVERGCKVYGLLISIATVMVCIGCQEDENSQVEQVPIKIQLEQDSAPALAVEIDKVIQLDSSKEALFGFATRVDFCNDRIFVLDAYLAKTLFVFDKAGTLINRTFKGKGPGECLAPVDYHLDISNRSIMLYDVPTKRMMTYDLDLNLLGTKVLGDAFFCRSFTRYSDGWLVHFQNWIDDKVQLYSFLYYSEDFTTVKYNMLTVENPNHQRLLVFNPFSRQSYGMLLCRPFDQHLYGIDPNRKDQVQTLYQLDFGDLNITEQDLMLDPEIIYQKMIDGRRVTLLGNPIHTEDFIACSFVYKSKSEFFIRQHQNGKVFVSLTAREQLPRGELKCLDQSGQYFVIIVKPSDFADFVQRTHIDKYHYRTDGNHLLVFFSLT